MNERKRKNIIIMALFACITLMGIGYALLSQTLTINTTATISSTWDIKITNVEVANTVGYATDTTEVDNIADDGHSATITADLSAPGDTITYTVTVHNFGTIAGMYDVNTENLITPGAGQPSGIVTATTDVATSNSLKYLAPQTGEGTFNVTLKFEDIDELPDVKEYSFTITPNFIQTSESGVTPGGNDSSEITARAYNLPEALDSMVVIVSSNNKIGLVNDGNYLLTINETDHSMLEQEGYQFDTNYTYYDLDGKYLGYNNGDLYVCTTKGSNLIFNSKFNHLSDFDVTPFLSNFE